MNLARVLGRLEVDNGIEAGDVQLVLTTMQSNMPSKIRLSEAESETHHHHDTDSLNLSRAGKHIAKQVKCWFRKPGQPIIADELIMGLLYAHLHEDAAGADQATAAIPA